MRQLYLVAILSLVVALASSQGLCGRPDTFAITGLKVENTENSTVKAVVTKGVDGATFDYAWTTNPLDEITLYFSGWAVGANDVLGI